jgi:hypothetical protein
MRLRITLGALFLGLLVSTGPAAARQITPAEFSAAATEQARRKPIDPSDPQTAAISGVVVDGVTKAPVAGAVVALSAPGSAIGSPSRQTTDAHGRFVFVKLAAATNYLVTAERLGYLPGGHTRHATPTAITAPTALRAGEWRADVRIALWRPGAISGVVTDERGEPFAGIFVRALSVVPILGREALAAGPVTTTDDRGVYRIAGLAAGRYLIQVPSVQVTVPASSAASSAAGSASIRVAPGTRLVLSPYPTSPAPRAGRARAYPMTFHSSARTVAEARVITLDAGEERVTDVQLEPVDAFRVSGRVDGPAGSLSSLTLRLLLTDLESLGIGSEVATAVVASDGTFTFANVPEGTYSIEAPRSVTELATSAQAGTLTLPPPPGRPVCRTLTPDCMPFAGVGSSLIELAPTGTRVTTINLRSTPDNYWGRTPVTVAGTDTTDVRVSIRPAGVMRGTAAFETVRGRPKPRRATGTFMYLEPAAPGLGLATLSPRPTPEGENTDTFTIEGLLAGPYWLRQAGLSFGWVVKSITWNGRDYTDVPVDTTGTQNIAGVAVTLTNGAPVVTGVVRDRTGNPVSAAVVLAFPTDRTLWSGYGLRPTRIKFATTTSAGEFEIRTLPAGDYFMLATDGRDPDAHHAPGFFERNAHVASRHSLSWNQTHTVDLVLAETVP